MEKNRSLDIGKEVFISYKNDNEEIISGYFLLVKFNDTYIQIKTKGNIVTIPMHRVLKIKERLENG